jgi:hypothetical protein
METTNYDQHGDSDVEHKNKMFEQESQQNQKIIYDHVQQQQAKSSPSLPTPNYSSQIQCMQEEILQLRSQIALLQSELACREYIHEKAKTRDDDDHQNCECKNEDNENDKSNYTSDDLCETADIFDVVKQHQQTISPFPNQLNEFAHLSISDCHKSNVMTPVKSNNVNKPLNQDFEMPIPKVAERVKLKRAMEESMVTSNEMSGKDASFTLLFFNKKLI